ncbi:HD family phosphohydrolase [Lusitaniella coriacea]|uniref:HD family phosphohydrolase n=1 Tax=Lusitaniella coriacea TaxID=1983105 RepID=UPI003CEC37AF
MKSFRVLTEQLKGWRQQSLHRNATLSSGGVRTGDSSRLTPSISRPTPPRTKPRRSTIPAPFMLVLAVVSLTSAIGYRFYNQPKLKEGTIAPRDIIAPKQAEFEDIQTTEAKRKEAQAGVVVVLQISDPTNTKVREQLGEFIDRVEQKRDRAGLFPFVEDTIISQNLQQFLRASTDEQWEEIIATIQPIASEDSPPVTIPESSQPKIARAARVLSDYRQQFGEQSFLNLIDTIQRSRQSYTDTLTAIEETPLQEIEKEDIQPFLDLTDNEWEETKQAIVQSLERILTQGIPPGLPLGLKRQAIQAQLKPDLSGETLAIATDLLNEIVEPNLIEDAEETKRRATLAVQNVDPEMVEVEKGQVIVEKGQKIERQQFVLLDNLKLSRREINWTGLAISAGLVTLAIGAFWLVQRRLNIRLRCRDRILLCLLSISTPLLVSLNVKYTNFPAVGLLVSSFYSPTLAVTHITLLSGLTTFSTLTGEEGMIVGWEYLIPGAVGGLLAAAVAGRMRSREELALFGGVVGLTQGGINLIVTLIISSTPGTIWSVALPGAALFGVSGIAWWVVALGLSPYLEKLFDLVTPIRLSELSNPNRPLLKRLATEAPGTFQHTLFVSSLAEAAARELHCNVELVRAGTLYHDIGKMHDPLGFIENQMGGPNKHDAINNPQKSAQIIKKHVSEGLVMARKYNLPQALRNFIPEHQGTILISYFYFQAKQKAQEEGKLIEEADYRYDGPTPQSKETGIVMLADACEAALRSLKDVTPDIALATVKKIFKARWQDEQLVDSGLKKEELPIIADVFIRVWQQYNHQRIVYPKAAFEPQPSAK